MSKQTNTPASSKAQLAQAIKLEDLGYPKANVKAPTDVGNKVGKATGLRLTHYVNTLFSTYLANDTVPDDETIAATLKAEFPARPNLQSVASYRSYWNQGEAGFGIDEQGQTCQPGKASKPFALMPVPSRQRTKVAPTLAAKLIARAKALTKAK